MRELLSHARSVFILIPWLLLATLVMGLISFFCSFFDATGRLQHKVAVRWARMLLAVFQVRVEVLGAEKLEPDRQYVFCSNHFSLVDTPIMFSSMPREFRILARHGLWRIPFIGWHLNRAGHVPVNRENPRQAKKSITRAAEKIRSGYSTLLFPEGGRTRSEQMRPFKPGAAYIAIEAGVPIAPMAIVGSRNVLAPGSTHLRPGRVELRVGDPVPTEGLKNRDAKQTIARVQQEVARIWNAPAWP